MSTRQCRVLFSERIATQKVIDRKFTRKANNCGEAFTTKNIYWPVATTPLFQRSTEELHPQAFLLVFGLGRREHEKNTQS